MEVVAYNKSRKINTVRYWVITITNSSSSHLELTDRESRRLLTAPMLQRDHENN